MLPDDVWMAYINTSLVGHTGFGNGQVWQTSETYLFDRNAKRGRGEIYRITVTGPLAGTEELLIEDGRGIDTGL